MAAQERLHRGEWAAVALAGLGTIGVGASSGEEAPKQAPGREPSMLRILGVLALMCGLVATASLARMLQMARQRRAGGGDKRAAPGRPALKSSATAYGLQVRHHVVLAEDSLLQTAGHMLLPLAPVTQYTVHLYALILSMPMHGACIIS